MRDRQTCIGCGKKSPETDTNYTLISSQFGWRLTRTVVGDGTTLVEWRCPHCWAEYKKARGVDSKAPASSKRPSAPDADPVTLRKIPVASQVDEKERTSPLPPPRSTGRPR